MDFIIDNVTLSEIAGKFGKVTDRTGFFVDCVIYPFHSCSYNRNVKFDRAFYVKGRIPKVYAYLYDTKGILCYYGIDIHLISGEVFSVDANACYHVEAVEALQPMWLKDLEVIYKLPFRKRHIDKAKLLHDTLVLADTRDETIAAYNTWMHSYKVPLRFVIQEDENGSIFVETYDGDFGNAKFIEQLKLGYRQTIKDWKKYDVLERPVPEDVLDKIKTQIILQEL